MWSVQNRSISVFGNLGSSGQKLFGLVVIPRPFLSEAFDIIEDDKPVSLAKWEVWLSVVLIWFLNEAPGVDGSRTKPELIVSDLWAWRVGLE